MGAQSDFVGETFVASESHKAKQIAIGRSLIATGVSPAQVAAMLSISEDLLTSDLPDSN